MKKPTYVLVEDDSFVRRLWLDLVVLHNISLFVYSSASEFFADFDRGLFQATDQFYLDQDIGISIGQGIRVAQVIKAKWPDSYVAMVTNYDSECFRSDLERGTIDAVFEKFPDHLFKSYKPETQPQPPAKLYAGALA